MGAYLLNLEDDIGDILLERQYLTTPARHLYITCWFLSIDYLGDQCLFLAYPHSLTAGDLC